MPAVATGTGCLPAFRQRAATPLCCAISTIGRRTIPGEKCDATTFSTFFVPLAAPCARLKWRTRTANSAKRRRTLLDIAAEEGIRIVEDAPYVYISYSDSADRPQPFVAMDPTRTVRLFTRSKIGLPGPRIGFIYTEAVAEIEGGKRASLTGAGGDRCRVGAGAVARNIGHPIGDPGPRRFGVVVPPHIRDRRLVDRDIFLLRAAGFVPVDGAIKSSRVMRCSSRPTRNEKSWLNIRNKATEELAATLASLTGETKTQAVTQALRDRLDRIRRRRTGRNRCDEPERSVFNQAIEAADRPLLSVASFLEASMVIEARHGPDGVRDLDLFIAKAGIDLVAVDSDQAYVARTAFRTYSKGRHAASLNFGDCFAYALAKTTGESLLFKGSDFSLTGARGTTRTAAPARPRKRHPVPALRSRTCRRNYRSKYRAPQPQV